MKNKNHNQFIRCIENIQDLSAQKKYNYALVLGGGGIFSRKTIKYIPKTGLYYLKHHVDGAHFTITEKEFKRTLCAKAMKKRCLIAIID